MQVKDAREVNWTAGDNASADALFSAMNSYFTFRTDAMDRLDLLLKRDPEVPAAHVLKGSLLMFSRSAKNLPAATEALEAAEAVSGSANNRERLHISALRAWIQGDVLGAQNVWDAILVQEPHDLLALRLQHFNAMFLGRSDHLRALAGRSLSDWSDEVPGAGFAYGMACMGLEEAGEFERAEWIGRRGAELEPDDLWCVHSVAHVMEGEGRLDEGLAWMVRPETLWEGRGPMRHHLWWHEALFLFETGDYDRALDYYDRRLAPQEPANYMELSNAASLLLRLESTGVECGDRWQSLAMKSDHMIEDRSLTFSDIHTLITFAMARDKIALRKTSDLIVAYASTAATYNANAASRVAVPLATALSARLRGDARKATDTLIQARFDFPSMGGSNAQRDVLEIFLIDCVIAAGDRPLARRLLNQYLDQRPEAVPMRNRLKELEAV